MKPAQTHLRVRATQCSQVRLRLIRREGVSTDTRIRRFRMVASPLKEGCQAPTSAPRRAIFCPDRGRGIYATESFRRGEAWSQEKAELLEAGLCCRRAPN